MEEQRQRQEDEQRRALAESDVPAAGSTVTVAATATATVGGAATAEPNTEEAMLQRALALSTETPVIWRTIGMYVSFLFFRMQIISGR